MQLVWIFVQQQCVDQYCLYIWWHCIVKFNCLASYKLVIMSDIVIQYDLSFEELDCDLHTFIDIICGRCPLIALQKILFRIISTWL